MRERASWPKWLVGCAVFVAALVAAPLPLRPSLRPGVEAPVLDVEVERVSHFLEARAPVAVPPELRRPLASAVVEECRAAGFDPLYVLAVMEVESDFSPDAVSRKGATGLMQLRKVTVREVERLGRLPALVEGEPEAVRNVRIGIRYLSALEERYPSRETALAAWNAGPGKVDRELREEGTLPRRWLRFARQVTGEHRRLRAQLGVEWKNPLATASDPAEEAEVRAD